MCQMTRVETTYDSCCLFTCNMWAYYKSGMPSCISKTCSIILYYLAVTRRDDNTKHFSRIGVHTFTQYNRRHVVINDIL